jgi:ribose transport system substrate-binding protein
MDERCGIVRRATRRRFLGGAIGGASLALLGPGQWAGCRVAAQDRAFRIVLIPGQAGDPFYISLACGAQAAAESAGATLAVSEPAGFDPALQTPLLAAAVQRRPDAILIAPTDTSAMIAPIQAAIDAGIVVVTVDTTIDADIALASVASDNVAGGRLAAQALLTAIGAPGKVFVVNTWQGISSTDAREHGFAEEIKAHPGATYLGQAHCDGDQDTAAALVVAKLKATPDLAGVCGTNLDATFGAARGLAQAGTTSRVKLVGFDAAPDQVDQLRAGTIDALIAQHPFDIGSQAVAVAVAYLTTKQPPKQKVVTTGFSVVTRDNLADPDIARSLYVLACAARGASPVAATPPA